MKKVCAITGAAGGIGFGCAKKMGESHALMISDVNEEKLGKATAELRGLGFEVKNMIVDVSRRDDVRLFAQKTKNMGPVSAVIHLAGLTPTFSAADKVMWVNTMGAMNINEEFYEVMERGGCIMDICSSAAYMVPEDMVPYDVYKLSRTDRDAFFKGMMEVVNKGPEAVRAGMAYSFSRNFIKWYVKDCCYRFGRNKGIRVLSVAPGIIETGMSTDDMKKSGNLDVTKSYIPLGRLGKIEEAAFLISTLVDERNSYVSGIDVLCDGGAWGAGYTGQRSEREGGDFVD